MDLELTAPLSHRRQRGTFALLALATISIGCLGGIRFDPIVAMRNGALLGGIALVSTVILPSRVAWMPPALLPMVTWLFGIEHGGIARPWAILMHPGSSSAALIASVCALAAGLTLFIGRRMPLWTLGDR